MPKYYVSSGELSCVVIEDDAKMAAVKSLSVCSKNDDNNIIQLDHEFHVNEIGFESPPDISFSTTKIIIDAGWEIE